MNDISIVIPLHNEAPVLRPLLTEFLSTLDPTVLCRISEIFLVENGSTDATAALCEQLKAEFPGLVRPVSAGNQPNYGRAIKLGIGLARGSAVAILEIDFLNADFLRDAIALINDPSIDVVVGSKNHPKATDDRPLARKLLSAGLNRLLKTMVGYSGTDTRGVKLIRTDLARHLCSLSTTEAELFQTELVLLAWRLGKRIVEIPVTVHEVRPASTPWFRRSVSFVVRLPELRRSIKRSPFHER